MKAVTSAESPIRVVEVVPPNGLGGLVAITLAPGKKTVGTFVRWDRDLATDLDLLTVMGITCLVPFLEDEELERLRIPDLVPETEARGMAVRRFPFHDGGIPADMEATIRFVRSVMELYEQGERVLMHCNGGLGRAGSMAACVRLALGLDPDPAAAIESIRKLRSERAIETKQQEQFIERFWEAYGAR